MTRRAKTVTVQLSSDDVRRIREALEIHRNQTRHEADAKAKRMPEGCRDSTMDWFATKAETAYAAFLAAL